MKKILILFAVIIIIDIILFFSLGCQKAPVIQDKEIYPCFKARDCHYRNKDNPERCIDDDKECRSRERYIYCKKWENRWDRDTEQGCWDKLNSK